MESLILNGLQLNDGTSFIIPADGLAYTPAQKQPLLITNPAADGSALFQESHYTPASFDITVRIKQQTTMAAALVKAGELIDRIQSCERVDGGVPLEWKPHGATNSYTAYALSADLLEVPTEAAGDLAGWLIRSPVVKLKLTCRPFLYAAERTAKASTESPAEPIQILYVPSIGGDVPAEARLILTDKATQNRRYLEVGWDSVAAEGGDLLLTAADLTVTGFAGTSTTRAGAFSEEKVKRITAIGDWVAMAGTGVIGLTGSFRVEGRFYTTGESARVRISYRAGEGQLTTLEQMTLPVVKNFCQIDLGEILLPPAVLGSQKGEVRVEVKSATTATPEVDLNYLALYPTARGYMKARGAITNVAPAAVLSARSGFDTEAGAITGDALATGGTWEGGGDAVDFTVEASIAKRTEVSDAAGYQNGRLIRASTPSLANCAARVDAKRSTEAASIASGVILRYVDASNFLLGLLSSYGVGAPEGPGLYVEVLKRAAATDTILYRKRISAISIPTETYFTIQLAAFSGGLWIASYGAEGASILTEVGRGVDNDLAGGSGKLGVYDGNFTAAACTRTYDNFFAWEPEAQVVCYSGREAEVRSDGVLREDSSGTYYGPAQQARGSGLYLQPAGAAGAINRLVIGMRRNDVAAEPDANVTDKHAAEVKVRERYLAPR